MVSGQHHVIATVVYSKCSARNDGRLSVSSPKRSEELTVMLCLPTYIMCVY